MSLHYKYASIRLSYRQACRAFSGLLIDGGDQPIVGSASPGLVVLSSNRLSKPEISTLP